MTRRPWVRNTVIAVSGVATAAGGVGFADVLGVSGKDQHFLRDAQKEQVCAEHLGRKATRKALPPDCDRVRRIAHNLLPSPNPHHDRSPAAGKMEELAQYDFQQADDALRTSMAGTMKAFLLIWVIIVGINEAVREDEQKTG
jgi:hypothetical protein